MADETRDALVGWLADALAQFKYTDSFSQDAADLLDRLAAEDSPVLLVARGERPAAPKFGDDPKADNRVLSVMYDVGQLARAMVAAAKVAGADDITDEPTPEWIASHDAHAALMNAVFDLAVRAEDRDALVARGDVEERVEWGVRYPAGDHDHEGGGAEHVHRWATCEIAARDESNAYGKPAVTRTVRSWSLPDGSRVEVTGPWTEVEA